MLSTSDEAIARIGSRKMAPRASVVIFHILLFINGLKQARAYCNNVTLLSSQLDTLLAEYDREVLPDTPTVIGVAMDLRHASIDDSTSTVHLLADLHMEWVDTRILWNSTEWNCGNVTVYAERLWLPDLVLMNPAVSATSDVPVRAQVSSDGRVFYIDRIDVVVPIAMQLEEWPNDYQTVIFKFSSRAHNIEELDFYINEFNYMSVWGTVWWDLEPITASTTEWSRDGEDVRLVAWQLRLLRRAPAHSLASGVVFAAAVMLLIAAGALPPTSRAPLCACAAFTCALWLISALARLPDSSTTPVLVSLMATVCVTAALGCASAAIVQRVARVRDPPPHALRALLANASAVCKLTPNEIANGENGTGAWAAAAQLLDRVLLSLLALTVFTLVCFYP